MRLELAKHEWARMKANDSLECRNCHSAIAMDFTKQTRRAADIHGRFLIPGERTCIDCHKGIAHELPDMTGIEPGWREPPELRGKESSWRGERETLRQYLAELQIFE
jgi:cytochrome c-type protein NapC